MPEYVPACVCHVALPCCDRASTSSNHAAPSLALSHAHIAICTCSCLSFRRDTLANQSSLQRRNCSRSFFFKTSHVVIGTLTLMSSSTRVRHQSVASKIHTGQSFIPPLEYGLQRSTVPYPKRNSPIPLHSEHDQEPSLPFSNNKSSGNNKKYRQILICSPAMQTCPWEDGPLTVGVLRKQ